ncbi:MAG: hypothetical protein EOO77_00605 [Oxalobacteraceae bacterium]|nr:MAG: hypothetical protein EOO77_00605 [Oxalobacteraceae bacterium]
MTKAAAEFWTSGGAGLDDRTAAMAARRMITARDALNSWLPSSLLVETALSVLLRLFVAHVEANHVTAEDLASSGFGAEANIVRWINALECEGMVALTTDGTGRCGLSPAGLEQMRSAIAAVVQSLTDLHAAYPS